MTIVEMLEQSGILTVLGMAVVFGFLIIMIICIALAGKLIHALGLDKDVGGTPPVPAAAPPKAAASATTAVISAAVAEYRKTNP
ncbi:MAG: OadG family protein [Spirochaetaceae bacterium]|nr:OadG family protein [Spirochaetaceae bacterium]